MGAFNYVRFVDHCPGCGVSTEIVAQTHMASDYFGDKSGAFSNRTYQLEEKMAWYAPTEPEFEDWIAWPNPDAATISETCYAHCQAKNHELYANIEFENVTPIAVTEVGWQSDMPD